MNKKYFVSCSISLLFIFISSSDDAFAQQKKTENNIVTDSCTCTQTPARLAGRYTPPLNIFTSYDQFFEATHTEFLVSEQDYKLYGFRDTQTDVGQHGGESYYSMTIASKIPIRLTNPEHTFTLNLTPCKVENKSFDLPVSMAYNFPIRTYIPDFDPKSFDRYASSYFDIYSHMTGLGPEDIFQELLEKHFTNDEDESYTMLNRYIVSLNKRFKTSFKTIPPFSADQKYFDAIMAGLKSRKVDFRELVINDFIFMGDTQSEHVITEGEAHQLEYIFRDHWQGTIETIDNYIIRPQFRGSTHGEKIGIEIDQNILRSWNSSQSKPEVDSAGKDKTAVILAGYKSAQFSNEDGIEVEITSVCMYPSEIKGTGMLLHFRNAQLVTSDHQRSQNSFKEINYPMFIKDSIQVEAGREKYYEYELDPVLDNFSGLMVPEATLSTVFKKKVVQAKVTDMVLNNRLISGKVEIPLTPNKKSKPEDIYLGTGKPLKTNKEELEAFLRSSGLTCSKIEKTEATLVFYFKKVL